MRTLVAVALGFGCSKPSTEVAPPVATPTRPGVDLPGDANGLYWDVAEQALYLTDSTHDDLVRWTETGGFAPMAQLPSAARIELGGLTREPDGRFVITSFGFGTDGGVFVVDTTHQVTAVPGLDKARRRIGIARAADGALYDAYFVVGDHQHRGGVARLDLDHGETDVVTAGLAKPVGVAVSDQQTVFISDQETGTIFTVRGTEVTAIAKGLASADLLTILPDGTLVTGGKAGAVVRIALDGTQTTIASGFEQVRGTAYDPMHKRLFVVEHSRATSNHKLHIIPYPP